MGQNISPQVYEELIIQRAGLMLFEVANVLIIKYWYTYSFHYHC